jgi:hypothetical protein
LKNGLKQKLKKNIQGNEVQDDILVVSELLDELLRLMELVQSSPRARLGETQNQVSMHFFKNSKNKIQTTSTRACVMTLSSSAPKGRGMEEKDESRLRSILDQDAILNLIEGTLGKHSDRQNGNKKQCHRRHQDCIVSSHVKGYRCKIK